MDMIPDWLEGWLSNPGSPADWLRLAWFNGEPLPGSEWTRDAELNRWIANSESDPVAWEGCRRLLERTGPQNGFLRGNQPCWTDGMGDLHLNLKAC